MKVLTVTELTLAIKRELEPKFAQLQVQGEVTNLRHQASGHLYFSLKDQGAQISAVLFRGNAQRTSRLPKEGDQVIVRGELSLYAPRGSYQIIVRELEHAGVGELLVKLHQLKEKLKRQGWLDPAHKKPLPKYPQTIGVVTSPTGSVIQDIIHVLKRRTPKFHLILSPVRVQGAGAADEIAAAIQQLNAENLVDVMIVGRGGGSLEDLWPFNEEQVASAIFHSKIPVISAVGHETDLTLADCVADVRAPTPSAAAEISVKEQAAQIEFLQQIGAQLDLALRGQIKQGKALVESARRHPLLASPYAILSEHYQRVDDYTTAVDRAVKHKLSQSFLLLNSLRPKGMHQTLLQQVRRQKEKLKQIQSHLEGINPENLLKKGYCIPFAEKTQSVMMSTRGANVGARITLRFHDGNLKTRIEEVETKQHDRSGNRP